MHVNYKVVQTCLGNNLQCRAYPLLPTGSLLGRPGSLKRPKPLLGSLLGLFLFEKSPFSAKSCIGSLFFSLFFAIQAYDFWKVTQYIKEENKFDLLVAVGTNLIQMKIVRWSPFELNVQFRVII